MTPLEKHAKRTEIADILFQRLNQLPEVAAAYQAGILQDVQARTLVGIFECLTDMARDLTLWRGYAAGREPGELA